jgi:hypothetical protein
MSRATVPDPLRLAARGAEDTIAGIRARLIARYSANR